MPYDLAQRIAERVKAELKNRGGTQQDLADCLGTTQPSISRRLRGAAPFQLSELARLATFFHITVEDLIGGRAAENSGQHTVSPAPTHQGEPGSRERLDRPAATDDTNRRAS